MSTTTINAKATQMNQKNVSIWASMNRRRQSNITVDLS